MAILILVCFTSILSISSSSPLPINASAAASAEQNPELVIHDVLRSIDISLHRRLLGDCGSGNPVDDCWRCDPSWAENRQRLADCAVGFGRNAIGGKNGNVYVVNDSSDDAAKPAPGTLRYGIIQDEPLWIIFENDMTITPKQELLVNSHKTVDGRGADVVIGDGGACFTVDNRSNIIFHGLTIRNCKPAPSLRTSEMVGNATNRMSDGDGISVFHAKDVWIDHCTLEACTDGLIDVVHASTGVTVSNNLMSNHDKAMLLGHSDFFSDDENMQVTVAFNRFGPGLVQRMPRCRFGLVHVINNDYINWQIYAIGGSVSPTILSHGNRFSAGKNKEVTKRESAPESEWSKWTWISEGDLMLSGAFFTPSGSPRADVKAPSFANSVSLVAPMTASAGALSCKKGSLCSSALV